MVNKNKRKTYKRKTYKRKTYKRKTYKRKTYKRQKYKRQKYKRKTYKRGGGGENGIKLSLFESVNHAPKVFELSELPLLNNKLFYPPFGKNSDVVSSVTFIRHLKSTGFTSLMKTEGKFTALKTAAAPIIATNLQKLEQFVLWNSYLKEDDEDDNESTFKQQRSLDIMKENFPTTFEKYYDESLEPKLYQSKDPDKTTHSVITNVCKNFFASIGESQPAIIGTSPLLRCLLTTVELIKTAESTNFVVIIGPFKEATSKRLPGEYGNEYFHTSVKVFIAKCVEEFNVDGFTDTAKADKKKISYILCYLATR